MSKLRFLVLVMWCSVLVMPLRANAVLNPAQIVLKAEINQPALTPVAFLTTEALVAECEAILLLDKTWLLPVIPFLLHQVFVPADHYLTLPLQGPAIVKDSNLHTMLTTGP